MQTIPRFLCLSSASQRALALQVGQNGTFQHELLDAASSEARGIARVVIEQCQDGVTARVEWGDSVNTVTLARRSDNGHRLAVFIESLANDMDPPYGVVESDEHSKLQIALDQYQQAVADLEEAIQSEAWTAIHSIQSRRDLQAHTIALIVSSRCQSLVGVGAAA